MIDDPNLLYRKKEGDGTEITYRKRPDGTVYVTRSAVASAEAKWTVGGFAVLLFAAYSWWSVKSSVVTGVFVDSHGLKIYRTIAPVLFDARVLSTQHFAMAATTVGAVCVLIGGALWVKKRLKAASRDQ